MEENNQNKYLVKEIVIAKLTKLWDEVKYLLRQSMKVKKVSMKNISSKSNLISMIIYL